MAAAKYWQFLCKNPLTASFKKRIILNIDNIRPLVLEI